MKLLQKSNVIGAACLGVFALSFLVYRPMNLGLFEVGAILFWAAGALLLMKRPRGLGLPVALLAFVTVATQLHSTRTSLAEYIAGRDIQVSAEVWVRFWASVMPLILGGIFAAISFWLPGGGSRRRTRKSPGEQAVNPNA